MGQALSVIRNRKNFAFIFHDDMLLHSGPESTIESPKRLDDTVSRIIDNVTNQRIILTTPDSKDFLRKTYNFIRHVHSINYLELLDDLHIFIGSDEGNEWGCDKCMAVNTHKSKPLGIPGSGGRRVVPAGTTTLYSQSSSAKYCDTCFSKFSGNKWLYFNNTTGDLSYYNADTNRSAIIAAASSVYLAEMLASKRLLSGFAIVRPGGHHATRNEPKAFCILNNVAIATQSAVSNGVKRIFIFDWDAHRGDGLQHFVTGNTNENVSLFYASIHDSNSYPETGRILDTIDQVGSKSVLNVPVSISIGDKDYFKLFKNTILSSMLVFEPEIVLIAAGFDGLASDPLKIFALTPKIYGDMLREIRRNLQDIPIGLILEGGYDSSGVADCIEECQRALA